MVRSSTKGSAGYEAMSAYTLQVLEKIEEDILDQIQSVYTNGDILRGHRLIKVAARQGINIERISEAVSTGILSQMDTRGI